MWPSMDWSRTFLPKDVILLQYHLHIPGPDPLTNADSESRSEYYAVRGTPAVYFNGAMDERAPRRRRHVSFRGAISAVQSILGELLEEKKKATATLQLKRSGDKIQVQAKAEAGDSAKERKLSLRLVLIEDAVRYVGGNQVRFHHHLVRALPGGVEGKALADGKGEQTVTIDLAAVKKKLESYVADRDFPAPHRRSPSRNSPLWPSYRMTARRRFCTPSPRRSRKGSKPAGETRATVASTASTT